MTATWRRAWLALVLATIITRLPALTHPRPIGDEQVYAVVAQVMHHGGLPYVDAIERKPPLLFLVYQGVFAVAGERNWFALHLVAVAWTLATMWLLACTARRLFGEAAGWWAACLYALFLAWGDHDNLAFNGELLMNLPIAAAFWIALGEGRRWFRPELLLAGGLIALAFLLKQPAAIAGVPLGLYVLRRDYRASRGIGWRGSLVQGALLAAGCAAVLGASALLLHRAGILDRALYWTFTDHDTAQSAAFELMLRHAPAAIALFLIESLPLLLLAGISLREGIRKAGPWEGRGAEFAAIVMLLLVSIVGVTLNGQFLRHYFLQLLPPLALLASPVMAELWAGIRVPRFGGLRPPALAWWLGATAVVFMLAGFAGLARDREPGPAGVYVRTHSAPGDRLYIWGTGDRQIGLYLDAERLPASRYIANFALTGHVFGLPDHNRDTRSRVAPDAWPTLFADLERHPPAFIIDADRARPDHPWPISRYPALADYLAKHYVQVQVERDGVVYARRRP